MAKTQKPARKRLPRHERHRRELKRYLTRERDAFRELAEKTTDNIGKREYHRAASELNFVLIFMREQDREV